MFNCNTLCLHALHDNSIPNGITKKITYSERGHGAVVGIYTTCSAFAIFTSNPFIIHLKKIVFNLFLQENFHKSKCCFLKTVKFQASYKGGRAC